LLEGKRVNLRALEKEDIEFFADCFNNLDFWGDNPFWEQVSKSEWMKHFENPPNAAVLVEWTRFIVQKKNGSRIGVAWHMLNQPYRMMEISYFLVSNERGKGYGTEVVRLLVDYLFLSKDIVRIQATTNVRNKASQRLLEKTGFRIEGTMRKFQFVKGVWTDYYLHSILRDEWKEPKLLTKAI
jgi:ribosomal-protein-alanine N-acetyltransferase